MSKQQGLAQQGLAECCKFGVGGSIDARYFQAQLCSLVNFLHLVHPEDMSPKSMSAKEVS